MDEITAYIFEVPSPEEDERFCTEAAKLGVKIGSVLNGVRYFGILADQVAPLRQRGFVVQDSLSWGVAQRSKAQQEATPVAAGPGTPGEVAPTTTITIAPAPAITAPSLPAHGPGATTVTTGPMTPGQVLIVAGGDMGSSGQVIVHAGPVITVPPPAPIPADVQIPQNPTAAPLHAPRAPTQETPTNLSLPTKDDLEAMIRVLPKVPPAAQRGRLALAPGAYLYSINDQGRWMIVWHAQLDDVAKSAGEVLGPFGGDKHEGWQAATAAAAEHAKAKVSAATPAARATRAPRGTKAKDAAAAAAAKPKAPGPTVAEYDDGERT